MIETLKFFQKLIIFPQVITALLGLLEIEMAIILLFEIQKNSKKLVSYNILMYTCTIIVHIHTYPYICTYKIFI